MPTFARLFRIPMRVVEPEPWALGMRFREEPTGLHRYIVAAGSPADGTAIADLPVSESVWISMVSRDGKLLPVRGSTTLEAGDEILALSDPESEEDPGNVFAP